MHKTTIPIAAQAESRPAPWAPARPSNGATRTRSAAACAGALAAGRGSAIQPQQAMLRGGPFRLDPHEIEAGRRHPAAIVAAVPAQRLLARRAPALER